MLKLQIDFNYFLLAYKNKNGCLSSVERMTVKERCKKLTKNFDKKINRKKIKKKESKRKTKTQNEKANLIKKKYLNSLKYTT